MMTAPAPDDPADVPTVVPPDGEANSIDAFLRGSTTSPTVTPNDDDSLEVTGPRYERKALLGRGGMGEVFLAQDPIIGRQVALKQMRDGVDLDPEARRRFLREARVQGQLEHPAIVPVYELARAEDGRAFFTMRRIRGESLLEILQRLRRGEPKETDGRRRLLNAFAQVCLAVDFAHERGVLHRDLKPANIMLGRFGEVYVLDWGLAKIEEAPELEAPVLPGSSEPRPQASGVIGTPGYASPEQLRSDANRSSDVYTLGAVLFEILTLERLHDGESGEDRVASTVEGANARIGTRFPGVEVPPELEAICVRATAQDPAERYPTARALHDALTAFLDGDRDHELRRAAAAEHAERAKALGRQALDGDEDARVQSLRSVGRALGLEPGNRAALGTLVELLQHPPETLPGEAAAEVDERQQQHLRLAARDGALGYVSWVLYVPLLLTMGIRDALSLGVSTALMALAAAVSWWASRRDRYLRSYSLLVMVTGTLALSSMTRLFGPYMLLPTIVMGQAVAFSLSPYRRERLVAAAMSTLGVLGPVALEWFGVIPTQTVFGADSITILPGITGLDPTLTPLVLAVASLALIVTPVILIGRARDTWNVAERGNAIRAWHLRQLVADDGDQDEG